MDTETTGFDPANGDRIVEIGAVEVIDGLRTGREFHKFINPCRNVPQAAVDVHGLTEEFLRDKPMFDEIVGEFLDFIGDDELIAHNADFDFKFINAEFAKLGLPPLAPGRKIDTLEIAKTKFPGSPASLDALCRRFGISLTARDKHGALIDSILLADVYLELSGGRQRTFDLGLQDSGDTSSTVQIIARPRRSVKVTAPSEAELAAHAEMVKNLKNPVWKAAS